MRKGKGYEGRDLGWEETKERNEVILKQYNKTKEGKRREDTGREREGRGEKVK